MVLWFYHSKPAVIAALLLTLLLPAFVFYKAVVIPASSCDRDFPSTDTAATSFGELNPDSSDFILEKVKAIANMELEQAYLTNLLLLSQQDSAYLDLDLADSILRMEIRGVTVRECRLSDIRVTKRLRCLDQSQLLHWISTPFLSRSEFSTIPKIRYMVKEAPKDTNEAALQSSKPIPSDTSSVFFTLYFNRHLALEIRQSEEVYEHESDAIDAYEAQIREKVRNQTMHALISGTSPEPEILIRIEVSKADARAIYRGIPVFPGLALKLK